jgi:hypothetical protein
MADYCMYSYRRACLCVQKDTRLHLNYALKRQGDIGACTENVREYVYTRIYMHTYVYVYVCPRIYEVYEYLYVFHDNVPMPIWLGGRGWGGARAFRSAIVGGNDPPPYEYALYKVAAV